MCRSLLQRSVTNVQKLHELAQNQLFELSAQSEQERTVKQSLVNFLMDDVEQAQTMLLCLEGEKLISKLNMELRDVQNNLVK